MSEKKTHRVKLNFSISEDSYNKIDRFINENNFNKSTLVEKLLLEYIKKNEGKNKENE